MTIARPIFCPIAEPLVRPLGGSLPWEGGGGAVITLTALLGSKIKGFLDERAQTLVSGDVSAWDDQSSGGTFDFTQGTANLRPGGTTTLNSLASPDFRPPTNADYMTSAVNASVALGSAAWEYFGVVYLDTVPSNPASEGTPYTRSGPWSTQSGAGVHITITTSGVNTRTLDTTYKSSGYSLPASGSITGQTLLIHCRHESGTIYARAGTGAEASAASGFTGTLATPMNLGAQYDGTNTLDGRMGLSLWCSVLTAAERAATRAFIINRWGCTG